MSARRPRLYCKSLYSCALCETSFSSMSKLCQHVRSHGVEKPYGCRHCNQQFVNAVSLYVHVKTHTTGKYHASWTSRNSPVSQLASSEKPYIYACRQCSARFSWYSTMRGHVRRRHTRSTSLVCTRCRRVFTTMTSLSSHVLVHTDGKRFRCGQCRQTFRHRYSLEFHVKQHLDDTARRAGLLRESVCVYVRY